MDNKIVLMSIVAIALGMLVANMFKDVCGCKVVEGQCEGEAQSGKECTWVGDPNLNSNKYNAQCPYSIGPGQDDPCDGNHLNDVNLLDSSGTGVTLNALIMGQTQISSDFVGNWSQTECCGWEDRTLQSSNLYLNERGCIEKINACPGLPVPSLPDGFSGSTWSNYEPQQDAVICSNAVNAPGYENLNYKMPHGSSYQEQPCGNFISPTLNADCNYHCGAETTRSGSGYGRRKDFWHRYGNFCSACCIEGSGPDSSQGGGT